MVKGFWDVVKKKDKMRKRNPGKRAGDGKTVSDKWSEDENPGEKGIGGMCSVTCIYVDGIYMWCVCMGTYVQEHMNPELSGVCICSHTLVPLSMLYM